MMELFGDLTWPLVPAVGFWLTLHDPVISIVWVVAGITARWHRRRTRQKSPYEGDDA